MMRIARTGSEAPMGGPAPAWPSAPTPSAADTISWHDLRGASPDLRDLSPQVADRLDRLRSMEDRRNNVFYTPAGPTNYLAPIAFQHWPQMVEQIRLQLIHRGDDPDSHAAAYRQICEQAGLPQPYQDGDADARFPGRTFRAPLFGCSALPRGFTDDRHWTMSRPTPEAALALAIRSGDVRAVVTIIRSGMPVARGLRADSPAIQAAWAGERQVLPVLDAFGAMPAPEDTGSYSLIGAAIGLGRDHRLPMLRELVRRGYQPIAGGLEDFHPISLAISQHDDAAVDLLIENASVRALNYPARVDTHRFDLPLAAALRSSRCERYLPQLLAAGARWTCQVGALQFSPLHVMLAELSEPALRLALELAPKDLRDRHGDSLWRRLRALADIHRARLAPILTARGHGPGAGYES